MVKHAFQKTKRRDDRNRRTDGNRISIVNEHFTRDHKYREINTGKHLEEIK